MKRLYQAVRRVADTERCELCAAPLAAEHAHLYEARARQIRCACEGCALIIPTAEHSPFRRVPRRFARVAGDVTAWMQRLNVPVGAAALIRRGEGAVVAFPGPAGLVESEVDAPVLAELVVGLPEVATLEPEVEAIVWLGVGRRSSQITTETGTRTQSEDEQSISGQTSAWIVGIDVVFKIVSEMREAWVGMSGGPDVPAAAMRVIEQLGGTA